MSEEFWIGLIGAGLGGGFTLFGVVFTTALETARKHSDEMQRKSTLLFALRCELECFATTIEKHVKPCLNEAAPTSIPLTGDYFAVYRNCAGQIGELQNGVIVNKLIYSYNLCFSFVSEIVTHNEVFAVTSAAKVPVSSGAGARNFMTAYIANSRGATSMRTSLQKVCASMEKVLSMITEVSAEIDKLASELSNCPRVTWQKALSDFFTPFFFPQK